MRRYRFNYSYKGVFDGPLNIAVISSVGYVRFAVWMLYLCFVVFIDSKTDYGKSNLAELIEVLFWNSWLTKIQMTFSYSSTFDCNLS